MSISEMDRYLFDCQGYVVLPQVLDPETVGALRRLLEETGWWDVTVPEQTSHQGDILSLGPPFWDLMDHPRIEPYLAEWLGPHFRLDHVYPIFKSTGGKAQRLHHGGEPFTSHGYYHVQNGTISCGLTVVTFALTDCGPGDGGFAYVPGSHKSAFPTPAQIVDWTDTSHTATVPMRAGDALIFTEALCHGSAPWTGAHPRISLLYKFSPGNSAWRGFGDGWPEDLVKGCTQRQREILEPPYVRSASGQRRGPQAERG
jgi:ectoine hydroxylase-related dioxygenase (phytanoyl-CoA dioxygenase family)